MAERTDNPICSEFSQGLRIGPLASGYPKIDAGDHTPIRGVRTAFRVIAEGICEVVVPIQVRFELTAGLRGHCMAEERDMEHGLTRWLRPSPSRTEHSALWCRPGRKERKETPES